MKNIISEPKKRGEVVCIGDQVSMGYAENRKELAGFDQNNGILYTGDIGYLDEEGYLYITGRKNRVAKIHGVRVDLSHVEDLARESFLQDVVAIARNERIILYTDAVMTDEELHDFVDRFSFTVNVFVIKKMKELPRNEFGKIRYGGEEYDTR